MKKSIIITIAVLLTFAMTISAFALIPEYAQEYKNVPATKYEKTFTDVDRSYWAFEYISEMVNRGILSGYPNGYFYPDNTITRGEFAKIMCLAGSIQISQITNTSYVDVSLNDWYAPYVEAGKYYLSGYISDGLKYYMPEDNALREDIAVALVKLKGYDTSFYDESILKAMFKDLQSISQDGRRYVSIAVEFGLISGYEDHTFRGQDTITRAEAATLLWRAYQFGSGNKVFEKEEFNEPVVKPEPVKPNIPQQPEVEKEPEVVLPEIVEEPDPEPEYLYEVKTIASNVDKVDLMITVGDGDGIVYLDGKKLMHVDKDGTKATLLLDVAGMKYIGTEQLNKSQLANLRTDVYAMGYNQNDGCLYILIQQDGFYIYNVTDSEVFAGPLYCKENPAYDLKGFYHKHNLPLILSFNNLNEILLDDSKVDNNLINGTQDDHKLSIPDLNFHKYIGNKLLRIYPGLNLMYIIDNKTGKSGELDYYIPGLRKNSIFDANDKFIYVRHEDDIYTIDSNGDHKIIFSVDDIDNVDGKFINFYTIEAPHAAVDNDGVVYYWDVNYKCIRQIEHK